MAGRSTSRATPLDRRLHAGWYVERAPEKRPRTGDLGRAGRARQQRLPSVWHRSRVGPETNDQPGAEVEGEIDHRVRERTPRVIGLGPDQKQKVVARPISGRSQVDTGPAEAGVHAVDQMHDRPAGAVVEELVGVEGGHRRHGQALQQCRGGVGGGVAGVDPALEAEHQNRGRQLGFGVELVPGGHQVSSPTVRRPAGRWPLWPPGRASAPARRRTRNQSAVCPMAPPM